MAETQAVSTKPVIKKTRATRGAPTVFVRVVSHQATTSIGQLTGKVVSFGPDGEPGQAAARKVFAKLGIKVVDTPLELNNALDGLASGDVAGVVIVQERDASKLRSLKTRELHLLSVPNGIAPPAGMKLATIPPKDMPGLTRGHAVKTFAVDASLLPHFARRQLASASK